jgi:gamma-glutamyltranspeptidase/glutathione hydrolase
MYNLMLRRLARAVLLFTTVALVSGAPAWAAPVTGEKQMIAAATPLAAEAGLEMLRAGGSAVDAAIAAEAVLGLVEPQSSGLGGGAFLLHYDAEAKAVSGYDGREAAPAAAGPDLFLDADGEPMGFWQAVVGGRSVGVPGLVRMLELAHRDHGRLPWWYLFEPAIRLAEEGFKVSPRLHRLISADEHLAKLPAARAYFYDNGGMPRAVGQVLKNPAYAASLRRIAEMGADGFYQDETAAAIVAAVRGVEDNPGGMTGEDLAGYQAKRRQVLCAPYRDWRICGMPPPTSGGVAVLQIMSLLARFDLAGYPPGAPAALHLVAEASRLAFADRNLFLADADFVEVPVDRLLDPGYLARRAGLIAPERAMGKAEPGFALDHGAMPAQLDPPATTHLSVVDRWGNAVSMTASIESAFGSRVMAAGFLLNNELTDFSFRPEVDGTPVANRVEGGKRPRSSMSPTLVLDGEGRLVMAVGSPGGSRIIGYVVKALVATLDWGLDMQQAISFPNFVNRNGATDLEAGTALAAMVGDLEALGHEVMLREMTSGLHGIRVRPNGTLEGGADPRREGAVHAD